MDKYWELGRLAWIKGEEINNCRFRNSDKKLSWMRGFKQAQRESLPPLEKKQPKQVNENIENLRVLLKSKSNKRD